jgi:butyryl-CoA dehydrogenase
MQDGAALKDLLARIAETASAARNMESQAEHAAALEAASVDVATTSQVLMQGLRRDPGRALANATLYLDSLGHVVVAWRWLAQALASERALEAGAGADRDFYAGKLAACRFFFRYELPRTGPALRLLRTLDDTALAIPDGGF